MGSLIEKTSPSDSLWSIFLTNDWHGRAQFSMVGSLSGECAPELYREAGWTSHEARATLRFSQGLLPWVLALISPSDGLWYGKVRWNTPFPPQLIWLWYHSDRNPDLDTLFWACEPSFVRPCFLTSKQHFLNSECPNAFSCYYYFNCKHWFIYCIQYWWRPSMSQALCCVSLGKDWLIGQAELPKAGLFLLSSWFLCSFHI